MDIQQAFDAGFDAVKAYVDNIADEFEARINAVEGRSAERGEMGERGLPGADGTPGRDGVGLADIIREADGTLIAVMSDGRTKSIGNVAVRDGVDGKNGIDGVPGKDGERGVDGSDGRDGADGINGKDGRDGVDGKDGAPGQDGKDGRDGRDGVDGKSVDMDEVRSMLAEMVATAVAAIPIPKDGKDGRDGIDGAKGADGLDGKDGRDGIDGRDGKDGADGIGLAGAVQNASGELVLTDTKGGIHNVGLVRGANGQNGLDGERGADGKDGRDGFGFDDMDLVETETGVALRFARGEDVKDFAVPTPYYRGTYKDDATYAKGNGVTFGGHYWIAVEDSPSEKPDTGKGWRMAVRKPRDGKDGMPGEKGERGAEGRPGKDLTQMGPDGSKW